jgi:hypothetical protein
MNELIIKITIVSKPLAYWQTNDPVIPFGQAAHVVENAMSQVRIGDGVAKWSALPDKNIDMSVAPHHGTHDTSGTDPISIHLSQVSDFTAQHGSIAASTTVVGHIQVASDADIATGTETGKAVNPKQLKTALDALSLVAIQATAPEKKTVLWVNTTDSTINYWNGSAWVTTVGRFADVT